MKHRSASGVAGSVMIYGHHPFDVVGWDGHLYPYAFNYRDFSPVVGERLQPPPTYQVFEGQGFVICNFVPRPLEYGEGSIKVPYYHSNVDSDEVMFYFAGETAARDGSGIVTGSVSLHPAAYTHGPRREAYLSSPDHTEPHRDGLHGRHVQAARDRRGRPRERRAVVRLDLVGPRSGQPPGMSPVDLGESFQRVALVLHSEEAPAVRETYGFTGEPGRRARGTAAASAGRGPEGQTVFVFMHPTSTLNLLPMPTALAGRGHHVLCASSRYPKNDSALIMEKVVLDLAAWVRWAREEAGYAKVVLVGWSGGGSLSLLYQAEAENPSITQTPAGDPVDVVGARPPRADGVVFIAAHLSRAETLTEWMDPSVIDEARPDRRDPELDIYAPDAPHTAAVRRVVRRHLPARRSATATDGSADGPSTSSSGCASRMGRSRSGRSSCTAPCATSAGSTRPSTPTIASPTTATSATRAPPTSGRSDWRGTPRCGRG